MRLPSILLPFILLLTAIGAHAETGITDKSIILGQSAALSGPAKELGTNMRDGALAYFDFINSKGGIHGRKIVLKTLDDGYEPERAAANTRQLIEQDNVFALFGYVGTPTSMAALPLINQADIPFFAPFTGAQSLREPFSRNIFHIRASYFEETEKIVEHATTLAMNRIAVFYQNDGYGKAGLEGVQRALKKRGLELAAVGTVERNSIDVNDAVKRIKAANPQTIIMVSAYKSCAAFIKAMQATGQITNYWNISFVGSRALATELGDSAGGVQISQVMPAPWDDINPVVKEYRDIYQKKDKKEWDYVSFEGFIAAKVFVEGLKRAGRNLSRDALLRSLESMTSYDAGGFVVRFGPKKHEGSHFVDLTVISKSGKFLR